MPEADDLFSRSYRGEPFSESAGMAFIQQSQLDFDIAFYDVILEHAPEYVDVLRCQGELLSRKGLHDRALAVDRRLAELVPGDSVVLYNLACSLAMGGLDEESLAALEAALQAGYDDFEHLAFDKDLDSLRANSVFHALLRRYAAER
jgi:tetratricopeptide (TPR) repeat protein